MNNLFVYGTLRHVPLLESVLGRQLADDARLSGVLAEHQVCAVQGEDFPILQPGVDGAVGLLLSGLSDDDVARLRFYEGSYGYDLEPVIVAANGQDFPAQVFRCFVETWTPQGAWSLENWADQFGAVTVLRAEEEMTYFGVLERDVVDTMLPMIKARATAKLRAQTHNLAVSPSGMTGADVQVSRVTRPYADFFAIEEYDLRFRRYDGQDSTMVRRAVFVATDATIVLPYDPIRDRVMLVEQFRPGPFARNDNLPWQLEPIAGRMDSGETPEDTAHREAKEEAGLTLRHLEEVAQCYASPGCSTEYYNIYVGVTDLPDNVSGISGLEEEAEDIRSYLFSYDALMDMVDQKQVVNAPLVLAALWLARHRARLRAAA